MSEIHEYMNSALQSYLDREIDVDHFRQTFAGAWADTRNRPSETHANHLADRLITPISEFSAGHRTEDSLREELALAAGLRFLPA